MLASGNRFYSILRTAIHFCAEKTFKFSSKKSEKKEICGTDNTAGEDLYILHPIFSPESDPPDQNWNQ